MEESNNCLEALINLIYLARHSASDQGAVERYLAEAENQALRLVAIHRRRTLHSEGIEESERL